MLKKAFNFFIYLLLYSPLWGYFVYQYTNTGSRYFVGQTILFYMVIPVFIVFLQTKQKIIVVPKILTPYVFYIIYIYIWNIYNGVLTDKGILKYLLNNYHVYIYILLLMVYNIIINENMYNKILKYIKLILFIAIIGALMQYIIDPHIFVRSVGWDVFQEQSSYLSRRPSVFTYVSDNEYGISVLAYFAIIVSVYLNNKKTQASFLYSMVIGLYAILTNGRYIMLGYILVLFQYFVSGQLSKKVKNILSLGFCIWVGIILYSNILGADLQLLSQKRLFSEGSITNTTRYLAFEMLVKYLPQNPLVGTGVHLTREIEYAVNSGGSSQIHVGYFSHLVSYGLIGSFFLFLFWIRLAKDLWQKAKITGYYGPFFGFIVFVWSNFTLVEYYIMYPGIIISIILSEYYYRRHVEITSMSKQNNEYSHNYNYA